MVNKDRDLKSYLDKEVLTVDFSISEGEPGLTLELNNGESVWTPVCVTKPRSNADSRRDSVLSVKELVNMDEIEFQGHAVSDAPGVILSKGNSSVWTPIATRTRSRVKT